LRILFRDLLIAGVLPSRDATVDRIVQALESLIPELDAFGESLTQEFPLVRTQTTSRRHDDTLYSVALTCVRTQADELDERCVVLIAYFAEFDAPVLNAFVQWVSPPFRREAQVAECKGPNAHDLAQFCHSVRGLLDPLRSAVRRGMSADDPLGDAGSGNT
jgi:hypothetical protein